ncbi:MULTISPECIES: GUN4 domain-containing protein [unclassified Leptolyngbya]|nr:MULTISPECIES: GUN4 domain-containing protein [unclassified Leptolyngbya]
MSMTLVAGAVPAATTRSSVVPPVPVDVPLVAQNDAYASLRRHLNTQNWQAADQETRRLLERWAQGNAPMSTPLVSNIPVDALQTLDQLWLEASNGRFGFSVQQRIWQEVSTQYPNDRAAAVRAFGRRVGWLRPAPDSNNFVSPDWFTEPELSNSLNAPMGHFPWAGVPWSQIQEMLNQQSCGSCMVDAMDLQGDRFYRYIPILYDRVKVALETPTQPGTQTWSSPELRFQIDLNSLYPSNRCPLQTVAQAISPNSQILAVSSYSYERACGGAANNSTLVLWNAQRGSRIITLVRGQAMESYAYRGQAQEPPTEQGQMVGDVANAIAFTPNSERIVAGMADGTVRIWSTATGQLERTLTGHRYAVRTIAISADGTQLVSASSDQTIKVWNLQTGQLSRTMTLGEGDGVVHTVKISPDGTRLAIATNRNELQLRNLSTGQLIRTFVEGTVPQPYGIPIAFSPDGRFLATSDTDNSVKVWNASTGARLITLQGHGTTVNGLAFSPDSQTLASSSTDYSIRLWNMQNYQLLHTLNGAAGTIGGQTESPSYLSFTADGRTLAASALLPFAHPVTREPLTLPGLTLWDVASGQSINQVQYATTFNFSPNGQFLLTNGHTLQVWQP